MNNVYENVDNFVRSKRNFSYCESKADIYKALKEYFGTYAEIFEFSFILGYINKSSIQLEKRVSNIPSSAFTDLGKHLIVAVGVLQENKIESLLDNSVFNEIEMYANGGINFLKDMINSLPGHDPEKMFSNWYEKLNNN